MIEKRVTVILYGSDRNLWSGGSLQIRVSDLFAAGGATILFSGKTTASTVELRLQLPFDAGQLYGLTFSAARHRPAWQIIRRLDFIRTPSRTNQPADCPWLRYTRHPVCVRPSNSERHSPARLSAASAVTAAVVSGRCAVFDAQASTQSVTAIPESRQACDEFLIVRSLRRASRLESRLE